jgi:hypothetical protein
MCEPRIVAHGETRLPENLPVCRHGAAGREVKQGKPRILAELVGHSRLGSPAYHQASQTCGVCDMSGERCKALDWPTA